VILEIQEFRSDITARKRAMTPEQAEKVLRRRKAGSHVNILAALRRAALVEALGGCCVKCRAAGEINTKKLEFDHIDPKTRTWEARKLNQYMRLIRYEHDAAMGLIQLLCKFHNTKKGTREPDPEIPF
jgi:DNA polymerase III delta prime subunit